MSHLILRELKKSRLTLSTEGLTSYSAPRGCEPPDMRLSYILESPFRGPRMGRMDTSLALQSLPMAGHCPDGGETSSGRVDLHQPANCLQSKKFSVPSVPTGLERATPSTPTLSKAFLLLLLFPLLPKPPNRCPPCAVHLHP